MEKIEELLNSTNEMSQQDVVKLVNEMLKKHELAVITEHIIRVVPTTQNETPSVDEAPIVKQ